MIVCEAAKPPPRNSPNLKRAEKLFSLTSDVNIGINVADRGYDFYLEGSAFIA